MYLKTWQAAEFLMSRGIGVGERLADIYANYLRHKGQYYQSLVNEVMLLTGLTRDYHSPQFTYWYVKDGKITELAPLPEGESWVNITFIDRNSILKGREPCGM